MLGIILSETLEVAYTLLKYTYTSSIGIYNWYYSIEDEKDQTIRELTKRIQKLENQRLEN
jgi:hypothetical protein